MAVFITTISIVINGVSPLPGAVNCLYPLFSECLLPVFDLSNVLFVFHVPYPSFRVARLFLVALSAV
jgi:hypothetical protein